MKRSEANRIIKYAMQTLDKHFIKLPPFAYYTPEQWSKLGEDEIELVENMLGWDISDFGSGEFEKVGLTIFTYRNGNFYNQEKYPKPYAEKYLLTTDSQVLPYHYHWYKMEDIIVRAGGDLAITMYNSTPEDYANKAAGLAGEPGEFADTDIVVSIDGKKYTLKAGSTVVLKPGQSICVTPGLYHTWQAVPGTGDCVIWEVSTRNDDNCDNRFYRKGDRIPTMVEDEPAEFLMFADYPKYTPFTYFVEK